MSTFAAAGFETILFFFCCSADSAVFVAGKQEMGTKN